MGSVLSSLLEEAEEKKKVPSGSSDGAGDGQAAAMPGEPTTSPGSGTEKKQSESSSSSSPLPQTATTTSDWVPYKFSEIVGASSEQRRAQVSKGIYLDGKKKKYWVDESTKANCFMLFARGLSITWGSDTRYWSWRKIKEDEMRPYTEEADIEVAYLRDVCWLEIRGSLDMAHLSPGYTYDVFFVAKLAEGAYGWSVPVELQLKFPSGSGTPPQQQSRKENIWRMDGKKEWRELKVGEVEVPALAAGPDGQQGTVDVAMLRLGGDWKRGLTLLGIKINNPRSNT